MSRFFQTILPTLLDPASLKAMVSWPKFSFTSYQMVSSLAKQGLEPSTVLDVGANVGQFAVTAAKLFPKAKVYAFEPHPDCYTALTRNTRNLSNVATFRVAAGETAEEVPFHINTYSHSSSVLPLADSHLEAFPTANVKETIVVKMNTLDALTQELTLVAPVLLKIDVQGYESAVIRGGRRCLKQIDFVVLESSFKPLYQGELSFNDMLATMRDAGFRFDRPVGWLSNPATGEIIQMDCLFTQNGAPPAAP